MRSGEILVDVARASLRWAREGASVLPEEILNLTGFSGRKYRMFINNLVSRLPNARYMEIGSFTGSTAVAAGYGNKAPMLCIDDRSEAVTGQTADQVRATFAARIGKYIQLPPAAHEIGGLVRSLGIIEQDFRTVDFSGAGKFNVYFYDGYHQYDDQYSGIVKPLPALDDEYVLIVDDWNWRVVRDATRTALEDHKCEILWSEEIRTTTYDDTAEKQGEESDWHNGYFIAVIRKGAASVEASRPLRKGSGSNVIVGVASGDVVCTEMVFGCLFPMLKNTRVFDVWNVNGNWSHQSHNVMISKYLTLEKVPDYLMFIDNDMMFPPSTLERLLRHEADIVGATYRRRKFPYDLIHYPLAGSPDIYDRDVRGAHPWDSLPAGMLLVHTSVLRALHYPWFFDSLGSSEDEAVTGDRNFCWAARKAGFDVMCDYDLSRQIAHIGNVPITFDIGASRNA